MTKKFKKRSLSESNVTEKSENKEANNVPVSPKKSKIEAVSNAQSNVVSKKMKKGPQGEANANKKKQEKNKNENDVKKVTPAAAGKEKEENQSSQSPVSQEGGLNRKERIKLKKAENNRLSKEKRKLFRREEGNVKTKTAQLSQEKIQERVKELESRENLSKTAKKKLAVFRKLLQVLDETNNTQKNTKTEETDSTNTPESTNSTTVAKKQNKKRNVAEVSEDKTEKKVKLSKTANKAVNESDEKTPSTQSANKQKSKKQKNANAQPGNLLRIKSKKNEEEDDDESSGDEETESEVKPTKEINKEDVEEEDEDEDAEEEEDEDDDDDDDDEEEDENEVEGEDEEEEEEDGKEEEDEDDEDDEEEDEDEETDTKLKKKGAEKNKEANDVTKTKGNEELKKKRYVVFVSNVPYSANADQIREHFLTKVSKISDVRIPKKQGTNQSRGFCYVELGNQEDYEKALSLNHSFLEKRRISVQYSPGSKNTNAKQIITAKNKKLDALRKEGKLAGSKKKTDKKVKKGKPNAVSTTA